MNLLIWSALLQNAKRDNMALKTVYLLEEETYKKYSVPSQLNKETDSTERVLVELQMWRT